jgi:hypothetical protein
MSRNIMFVLIHHCHKLLDLIFNQIFIPQMSLSCEQGKGHRMHGAEGFLRTWQHLPGQEFPSIYGIRKITSLLKIVCH